MMRRTLLLGTLVASAHAVAGEAGCSDTNTPEAQRFKRTAERLYLAYTGHPVKRYQIDVSDCGNELIAVAVNMGPDATIGSIVTISYSKDDKHITIRPGM